MLDYLEERFVRTIFCIRSNKPNRNHFFEQTSLHCAICRNGIPSLDRNCHLSIKVNNSSSSSSNKNFIMKIFMETQRPSCKSLLQTPCILRDSWMDKNIEKMFQNVFVLYEKKRFPMCILTYA
jgi:hypothetical protein